MENLTYSEIKNEIYAITVQPIVDIVSVLHNGLFKQYATYPRQSTTFRRNSPPHIYKAPCETTRESAYKELERIKYQSRSPIVRTLAQCF